MYKNIGKMNLKNNNHILCHFEPELWEKVMLHYPDNQSQCLDDAILHFKNNPVYILQRRNRLTRNRRIFHYKVHEDNYLFIKVFAKQQHTTLQNVIEKSVINFLLEKEKNESLSGH